MLVSDVVSVWLGSHLTALTTAGFKAYEMEDDVTKDLAEFALANAIYAALVEGHACEQSARYVMPSTVQKIGAYDLPPSSVVMPWTMLPRMPQT